MTVQDAIDKLSRIEDKSICVLVMDTRSGVLEEASMGSVRQVDGHEDGEGGELEVGTLYVPVYLG